MTTTREPLQVPGEHVVPVPPLGLPPAGGGEPLSQLRQNEAVLLFTERAAAASGTFELTSSNQAAVVQLCRRLDGLPLAIELAAVRTRVLTAEQILDRLTDRFALLTGGGRAALPRQQTLRTTIDWSHDLLTAAEQTLLRRLCVFAGRFTVDDAEAVCAYGEGMAGQALDVLSALVDKSLVTKEDVRGVACYRLHETMREYASLKLRDAAEEEVLDESFVEYYRTRCLEAEDDARHRTLEWLQWVELEIDNIRSALQKCLATSDWRRGLELATSIGYYWVTRGTTESMRWFDELLAAAAGSPGRPSPGLSLPGLAEHAADRCRGGPAMACPSDRGSPSDRAARAAVRIAVDGLDGGAHGGRWRGRSTAPGRGRGPRAARSFLFRVDRADPGAEPSTRSSRETSTPPKAASSDGARLSREAGDLYYLQTMLMYLGQVAMLAGDVAASKPRFVEALRIARQIDDRITQYVLLSLLSWHAATLRPPAPGGTTARGRGSRRIRCGRRHDGPGHATPGAGQRSGGERAGGIEVRGRVRGRQAHGPGSGTAPCAERIRADRCRRLPIRLRPDHWRSGRSRWRRLVAEGLTNKQIGTRLFISERTVATHVRNILNKLGFDSRAQIASWMASSGS